MTAAPPKNAPGQPDITSFASPEQIDANLSKYKVESIHSARFDARPLTLDQLREPIPPREFVIKPLIPRGVVAELSGAHGISKSTLALDMCLSIAAGYQWAGLRTRQGRVVFASREDSHGDILRRVQAWLENLGQEERARCEQAIIENLTILGRDETAGLKLTSKSKSAASVQQGAIDLITSQCPGVEFIVLETASRLSGGDEMNEDLAVLADALERIAAETGAAVMLIRHVSKSAARDKTTDSYAGRGGSALSDAARSVLILTPLDTKDIAELGLTEKDVVMLMHAKASYSAKAKPLYFVRRDGPILEPIQVKHRAEAHEERLLAYLRERHAQGAQLSMNQIKEEHEMHEVSLRRVSDTLARLKSRGLIRAVATTKAGNPCTVWVPVADRGITSDHEPDQETAATQAPYLDFSPS
ncbi:MAG: AAA family ATPase [Sulfuricaulis sp.]